MPRFYFIFPDRLDKDVKRRSYLTETLSQRLESREYKFLVDGTMPVLNFELNSGDRRAPEGVNEINKVEKQNLRLELYAPISGEVFEAKTKMGRIEVDNDGTLTYFSNAAERLTLSLFLGKSMTFTFDRKTNELLIKTPSKIVSISDNRMTKRIHKETNEPTTDELRLTLD